jgi:site-specific recombinase XerD
MSTWRQAVEDYIQLRRSLGFKLCEAKVALLHFASFLEASGASHLTIALALQWAQQDPAARPVEWARRLSFVRGFARHWSAQDPHTEVPPWGLLPHRPGRARPYLYSDDEVQRLLQAAQQLPPAHGLRGHTYHGLLGLLAVSRAAH